MLVHHFLLACIVTCGSHLDILCLQNCVVLIIMHEVFAIFKANG